MSKIPKVFISYAHDTEVFSDLILEFSNRLRENHIDANIDQYEESPKEGWPRWMENEIENADFVIVVCTETYFKKIKKYQSGEGKGVNWELNIIYQHLYDDCCNNQKFIPVVFEDYYTNNILKPLKSSTIYRVDKVKDFIKLTNRLKGIKNVIKPELGEPNKIGSNTIPLKAKERKSLFVTTLIDIDMWNKAKWGGAAYMFDQGGSNPPILGLTFENFDYGKKIFKDWKKNCTDRNFNELDISIIEGPNEFGDDGYFVHISTSMDYLLERSKLKGLELEDTLFAQVSRYNHMVTTKYANNLITFKKHLKELGSYYIAPACFINGKRSGNLDNIKFDLDLMIKMNKVRFLKLEEITKDDIEYAIKLRDGEVYKR